MWFCNTSHLITCPNTAGYHCLCTDFCAGVFMSVVLFYDIFDFFFFPEFLVKNIQRHNVFVFTGRLGKIFVDTPPSDIRYGAHGLSRIHTFSWALPRSDTTTPPSPPRSPLPTSSSSHHLHTIPARINTYTFVSIHFICWTLERKLNKKKIHVLNLDTKLDSIFQCTYYNKCCILPLSVF